MEKFFEFYKNKLDDVENKEDFNEIVLPSYSSLDINKKYRIPLSTIYFLLAHNKYKLENLMQFYYLYRNQFYVYNDMEEEVLGKYIEYKYSAVLTYEYILKNGLSIYDYFPGDLVHIDGAEIINLHRKHTELVCIIFKVEGQDIFMRPIKYAMDAIKIFVHNLPDRKFMPYDLILVRLNDVFYDWENTFRCEFIEYIGNGKSIDDYDRALLYDSNIYNMDRKTKTRISAHAIPFFEGDSKIYLENSAAPRDVSCVDLTNLLTLSIDPETTTDIDDAFSLQIFRKEEDMALFRRHIMGYEENRMKYDGLLNKINRGSVEINTQSINRFYRLSIHIADLSRFLSPQCINSHNLGNTFYFNNFKVEMIEKEISGDLASLVPGVDRFAISLTITFFFENDGVIITDIEICRSKINCDLKLSYDCAEKIFAGSYECPRCKDIEHINATYKTDWCFQCVKRNSKFSIDILREHFHIVNRFSVFFSSLRKSTYRKVGKHVFFDSHLIIENMMIMANMVVTMIIYSHYGGNTLMRYHERNDFKEREFLHQQAAKFNLKNINSIEDLYGALEEDSNLLIGIRKSLILNVMNLAKYGLFRDIKQPNRSVIEVENSFYSICEDDELEEKEEQKTYLHYGLGVDFYCHFTSPIRRYFDFLIHQQLISILENTEHNHVFNIELTLAHMNEMKRKQRNTGLMANRHFLYEKLKGNGERYSAIILPENAILIPEFDLLGHAENSLEEYSCIYATILDDDIMFYAKNKIPVKIIQ